MSNKDPFGYKPTWRQLAFKFALPCGIEDMLGFPIFSEFIKRNDNNGNGKEVFKLFKSPNQLLLFDKKDLKKTSIYRFTKGEGYFLVSRKDNDVLVKVKDGIVKAVNLSSDHQSHFKSKSSYCIVDKRNIVFSILRMLTNDEYIKNGERKCLSRWTYVRAAKCIARRVYAHINELAGDENELYLSVQKKIYSLSGKIDIKDSLKIKYLHEGGLSYLLKDAAKHRAAANFITELPEDYFMGDMADIPELNDWKCWYSHNQKLYPALTKTLMNLPGQVPPGLLKYLHHVKLARPIKDRVELILLLAYVKASVEKKKEPVNISVIMNAGRQEILKAFQYMEKPYLEYLKGIDKKEMDFRQYAAIKRITKSTRSINMIILAERLIDYPDPFHGRICGLTKKTVKWHNDEEQAKLKKEFIEAGFDTKLPSSNIDMSSIPGIQTLKTVQDVWDEGEKMHHCIRSYLKKALRGWSSIYHVTHSGEEATLAVYDNSRIEINGPYNHNNKATDYAQKKAVEIVEQSRSARRIGNIDLDDDLPF